MFSPNVVGEIFAVRIVVCDVGLGNLRSVQRALLEVTRERADDVEVSSDPIRIARADKLVMPGQGGFADCARALSRGIGDAVVAHIASGRPYLGICLGLQILFSTSEEAPNCTGLGILSGEVRKLRGGIDALTGAELKVPHMGWNVATPTAAALSRMSAAPEHFYFIHSFCVVPSDRNVVAATTEYGERFTSAICVDNLFACQFHPEKSQRAGLALLERFVTS
jgi:glutamine amidotransferase